MTRVLRTADMVSHRTSARWIANAVEDRLGLLYGLIELRSLGEADLVASILEVKALVVLRTSWELLDALVESDGCSADSLLSEVLDWTFIDDAKTALWGAPAGQYAPAA